ncbi:MAG: peptide-methionine (R)-S-oxide reductase [Sphingomonadales bacterium]|jgi:peptide-methionine (R)-S-oxide reductase|nr:peptide-methionine (R)-S-oxide reductase [Sphingomonadales bacterium]
MKIDRRAFLAVAGAAMVTGVAVTLPGRGGGAGAQPGRFRFRLTDAQWRARLNPAQFAVLREGHTERPGSSPLDREHRRGTFACAGCGQPLFASATKFESGTGWPSFYQPLPGGVVTREDRSQFMVRTEVLCARCGGHLGHVFNDGPGPTGLRYCMNGTAMIFRAA